ncbi:MAG: MarR family transcriptional regulator [Anaerotignaceae bacterium]
MIKSVIDKFYITLVINQLKLTNGSKFNNISYHSQMYLDIIAFKENCTVSYLAKVLNVAMPAVTSKIKELEKQGLVSKTQSQKDKRVFYLTVNPQLMEEYEIYDKQLYRAIEHLEKKYTESEISLFCNMVEDLNDEIYEDDIFRT